MQCELFSNWTVLCPTEPNQPANATRPARNSIVNSIISTLKLLCCLVRKFYWLLITGANRAMPQEYVVMSITVTICCCVSWCCRLSFMAAPLDTNRRTTNKLKEQEQLPFSVSALIVMTISINYVLAWTGSHSVPDRVVWTVVINEPYQAILYQIVLSF